MTENSSNNVDIAAAIRRKKTRKRRIIRITLLVVVLAVVVALIVNRTRKEDDPFAKMETARVGRATIAQMISATGSVTAQTGAQVKIGSQVTGRIKRLFADVGSEVRAGQVIAELDLPDVKAQLDQAAANLQAARLRLEQETSGVGLQRTTVSSEITRAQASVDTAKAAYDQALQSAKLQVATAQSSVNQAQATEKNAQVYLGRNRQLLEKGYISAQEVDNAQTQADVAVAQLESARQTLELTRTKADTEVETASNTLRNARAALEAARAGGAQNLIKAQQVAAARAAVKQAEAQVDYWRAQVDKTVIKTPISGTVLALDVQQGETIAAGFSAPTLIRVTDLERLQVDAYVDETDIGSLRLGQRAKVTVDAYPNRVFAGRVVKIAAGATMQQNVVTYNTTISLENHQGLLRPDMTATVEISVDEHANVLAVPTEAIKSVDRQQVVYLAEGEKITPRPVVTGVSDETVTEIRSGLKEGDKVILAGYSPTGQPGMPGASRMTPFGPAGGGTSGSTGRTGGGSSRP